MSFKLVIKEEADNEINESFNWYEQQKVGLGEDFLLEIDKALQLIISNPQQYAIRPMKPLKVSLLNFNQTIIFEKT